MPPLAYSLLRYALDKLNKPFAAAGTLVEAGAWEKLAPRCGVGALGRGFLWGGGAEVCLRAEGTLAPSSSFWGRPDAAPSACASRCDDGGEDEGESDSAAAADDNSIRADGGGGRRRRPCGACFRARDAMLLRLVVAAVALAGGAGFLLLLLFPRPAPPPIDGRPTRCSFSSGTSVCPVRTL